jgi:hypothetical protein
MGFLCSVWSWKLAPFQSVQARGMSLGAWVSGPLAHMTEQSRMCGQVARQMPMLCKASAVAALD